MNGLFLRFGKLYACLAFPLAYNFFNINTFNFPRRITQRYKAFCRLRFCLIQIFRVNKAQPAHFFRAQAVFVNQFFKKLFYWFRVGLQKFNRFLCQKFFRHAGMPGRSRHVKRINKPCFYAPPVAAAAPQCQRYFVGRPEAYARYFARKGIGVFLHTHQCRAAIARLQFWRIIGAYAVLLQKQHQFAHFAEFGIRSRNAFGLFAAYACNFRQPFRFAFHNGQCAAAKMLHNTRRHSSANALNRAGCQKTLNTVRGGRLYHAQSIGPKLATKTHMLTPFAFHGNVFAHIGSHAFIGNRCQTGCRFNAQHAKATVAALIYNIFQCSLQLFQMLTTVQNKCSVYYSMFF